jgi:hypothetical protein
VVVASKSRVPVIEYDEKSVAALAACREYLEEAETFLDGAGPPPDPYCLIGARFPFSTIREVRCDGADQYALGWPFVAAIVDDPVAKRERYFDPWYFAAMRCWRCREGGLSSAVPTVARV